MTHRRPEARRRQGTTIRAAVAATTAVTALAAAGPAMAARHHHRSAQRLTVASGQTLTVPVTTSFRGTLTVADGGALVAPAGDSLTLTVNGVETGQKLTSTGGTATAIVPGSYSGQITLTVSAQNDVAWQALTFPFRQGLYVDSSGVVADKSVFASVRGGRIENSVARDIRIASTGEAFDGVYVAGGSYTLDGARMRLDGNGRSDFVGYGSAIVGTGANTRLTVDDADISNQGAVRTGVVADGGANVIVKDSSIRVRDGVLPGDYQPTVDLTYMESAPWMLGIGGNVRATNLLGTDTKATYINSSISSEGWGALSTDSGQDGQLTAIDSRVTNTGGEGGYGSYAIGNATERFLGDRFDVGTYATINRGGDVYYGDSTPSALASLNSSLGLGLSARELAGLPDRPSVVNSRRFGFMWHGAGTLTINGGTRVTSKEATFLDKGQQVGISVDGSQGAGLNPRNGVLMQMIDNDDPGPVMVDGKLVNQGVYTQPTGTPAKVSSFDTTTAHSTDATATFTDTRLEGDFYNGVWGGYTGAPGPTAGLTGLNMVLNLDNSRLDGVISASLAKHNVSTITSANYQDLGEVTNPVGPVINNGVLVTLGGDSTWTVTGTSYLSKLVIGSGARVRAPLHHSVSMTVNGVPTAIEPGATYSGDIELTQS